jgi:hypothetical protein
MALNISINEKNIKYYIAGVVVGVIILTVVGVLAFRSNKKESTKWAETKPQSFEQVKDVRLAMPYVTDEYTISYFSDKDLFVVDYAGYLSKDSIEVKTVSWFKSYSDLKKVNIKYAGIGETAKTYDLTKDITELLKDNQLINPAETDKTQFGKS